MTQIKDLYNDTFNAHFVKNFPQVKPWLESEIPNLASKIDIEKAFSLMGYKIRMKDLHTDAYSELVGNVLYVNSNVAIGAQRYAIANTIGKLMIEQYANPKISTGEPSGEKQPLPKEVITFLEALQFRPMATNSLADAIIALKDYGESSNLEENDPVIAWASTDTAETQLANAYLHGYSPIQ